MVRRALSTLTRFFSRPSPPGDRRRWARFPCSDYIYYRVGTEGGSPQLVAKGDDISPVGIGLRVTSPLRGGQVVRLELPEKGGQSPSGVLAEVVRVAEPS